MLAFLIFALKEDLSCKIPDKGSNIFVKHANMLTITASASYCWPGSLVILFMRVLNTKSNWSEFMNSYRKMTSKIETGYYFVELCGWEWYSVS